MNSAAVRVELLDPSAAADALRRLRAHAPQPPATHAAALDAIATHVIAFDGNGQPLGSARLRPDQQIDGLFVHPQARGRGIASRLLRACVDAARQRAWPLLLAHVTSDARQVFACQGFLRDADTPLHDDGLLAMQLRLDGPMAVDSLAAAIDATCAVVSQARRELVVYSRALDPGLLDAPPVIAAFRRFATARHGTSVLVLLHDGLSPQQTGSPFLRLAQRLDSTFRFRRVTDPVDTPYPSAYLAGESGAYYFRPMGHRHDDGETAIDGSPRSRQLRAHFMQIWERNPIWSEFRALGI